MKLRIFIDSGGDPINYELNMPDQKTAETVIDELFVAFYSSNARLYRLVDSGRVVAIINTERLVCAMVQP